MVKSSEGQQSATNRERQSHQRGGALEKEGGGGGKVGYETESGELHVPSMLKHTQEGTPEKRLVKHGELKSSSCRRSIHEISKERRGVSQRES